VIKHLLIDLDNTLYSAGYGLEKEVSQRIEIFLTQMLGINREESEETHRSLVRDKGYGTTIEWLMAEHNYTDIDTYYAAIYPEDEAAVLKPDPKLAQFLASIPLPKAVLTNSNKKHAHNILNRLGIAEQFQYIFDITLNNYIGKPHREAFFKALEIMKAEPETTLFIDDYPEFVAGFLNIGGRGILLDEFGRHSGTDFTRVKSLYEIEKFLK